jgi:hypothetical protein
LRPPIAAPLKISRPQNGWNCNRRRFAGAAYYGASWAGDYGYPQPEAPAPEPPPPPVVNYVFVEVPTAAPPQELLGPRFIPVDRRNFPRPQGSAPLVIYGDAMP